MNNKTTWKSAKEVTHQWYEIDATGVSLGRLAGVIAKYLMGKTTATFVPNIEMGGAVVVLNADKVKFTGKKQSYEDIRHYTGFPGGLKIESVDMLMKKNPAKVIMTAVKGMLPDSKLKDIYLSRLFIYKEATHPHQAQKPVKITA